MFNPNKDRGRALFLRKLDEYESKHGVSDKLTVLRDLYADKVGVMPANGLFGAARMALACTKASATDDDNQLVSIAEELYESDAVGVELNSTVWSEDQGRLNASIGKDLLDFSAQFSDGQIEVLDLVDETPAMELTVEGARRRGLIAQDFDTTYGDAPVFDTNEDPMSACVYLDGASCCPSCRKPLTDADGAANFYVISTDTVGCLHCGHEPFVLRASHADSSVGSN